MTTGRKRKHAALYKVLGLPKKWIAVLDTYPNPLEVLPLLMATRSISVAEEVCEALEDLTDALLEVVSEDDLTETGELVTVQ